MPGVASPPPTIPDMVDALYIFTEPLLNSRYHGLLLRRQEDDQTRDLTKIPALVLNCYRLGREGSHAWANMKQGSVKEAEFIEWAETTLLDGFLMLAEEQLRTVAHVARQAPTAAIREPFDKMAATHREITSILRKALKNRPPPIPAEKGKAKRSVQEEEPTGDFRGQLEAAIRHAQEGGKGVRRVLLSHTGLRHLRDQGLFHDGNSRLWDIAVTVDLGWDAPAFVLETYDQVPLEEIIDAG